MKCLLFSLLIVCGISNALAFTVVTNSNTGTQAVSTYFNVGGKITSPLSELLYLGVDGTQYKVVEQLKEQASKLVPGTKIRFNYEKSKNATTGTITKIWFQK